MKVYNIEEVKKEWIHIRWYKSYTSHYLQPKSTTQQNELYNKLIDMHPKGQRFYPCIYDTYPHYDGFNGKAVTDDMFPSSNFVFLCRQTNIHWIKQNNTTNQAIKQLIQSKTADLVSIDVEVSQEQENVQTYLEEGNIFNNEDDNDSFCDFLAYPKDHPIYTDKMAMFRRASDLCGNDVDKHKELYDMLNDFVSKNEMNNCDNDKVLAKRKGNGSGTVISSNKVINTTHKSTKRKRAFYEYM